jgi:hypothetical protein
MNDHCDLLSTDPVIMSEVRPRLEAAVLGILSPRDDHDRMISDAIGRFVLLGCSLTDVDNLHSKGDADDAAALVKLCIRLSGKLEAMDQGLKHALTNYRGLAFLETPDTIREAVNRLGQSAQKLLDEGVDTRWKNVPMAVAKVARGIYEDATGKRATSYKNPISNKRESAFTDFLTAIYEALHMEASAEYYAEQVVG